MFIARVGEVLCTPLGVSCYRHPHSHSNGMHPATALVPWKAKLEIISTQSALKEFWRYYLRLCSLDLEWYS